MRADHAYRRAAARLRAKAEASGAPCAFCGGAIDYALRPPHPRSFSADHVTPLSRGGQLMGELRPAHLFCNASAGGRLGAESRAEARRRRDPNHEVSPSPSGAGVKRFTAAPFVYRPPGGIPSP